MDILSLFLIELMPKIVYVLTCERALIEEDTKSVSAIALFTNLRITVPEQPPLNAVMPKDWAIVIGWEAEEGDDGKEFIQKLEITLPDGKPFASKSEIRFKIEKDKRHIITTKLNGFPVGQAGRLTVQAWAELDGIRASEKQTNYVNVIHNIIGGS